MPPKKGGGAPGPAPAKGPAGLFRGMVLAAAGWLFAAQLGVPQVLKIGEMVGYLPAMGIGAVLGLVGLSRLVYALDLLLALAIAGATATPDAAAWFTKRHIRQDPFPKGQVQAVVVLSSNLNGDGVLDEAGTDRLLWGLGLVKRESIPLLVTTRFASPDDPAVTTDADQGRLIALAQPSARWVAVGPVNDTHDEALRTAALAKKEGFTRVAVVTSPMHTRRACAVFEAAGLTVTCVPSASGEAAVRSLRTARDRVRTVRQGLYETIGTTYYRLRGWLPPGR